MNSGNDGVLGARRLDAQVLLGHHPLPDGVAVGPDDHRAPHRTVLGQLGLGDDVLVPAREVVGLRGEHAFRHRRQTLATFAPVDQASRRAAIESSTDIGSVAVTAGPSATTS